MEILKTIGIILGFGLAGWGLFHQLIVGGSISLFPGLSDRGARVLVMGWVAQGAFMSFLGVLSAVMMLLHDVFTPEVHTVLIMSGIAMLFLAGHVYVTGFKTHMKPIRIGAVLELVYGAYLLMLVVLT